MELAISWQAAAMTGSFRGDRITSTGTSTKKENT
jgi:hypothetical protein